MVLPVIYLTDNMNQQEYVEDNLRLPCRPSHICTWNNLSPAASGKYTVDSRTHYGEYHTWCEDIKRVCHAPVEYSRQQIIEHRHEEQATEETHISDIIQVQRLHDCKHLHTQYPEACMQQCQSQSTGSINTQPVPAVHEPQEAEGCSDTQQYKQYFSHFLQDL